MKKTTYILIITVFIAAFLRFWQLGQIPPSLSWDEVAWGYNAYSLGISGKDEFGKFLPHEYLESYGDFKPPVYAYLDILPVKIFGLTEFAVRFPSAFFGTFTILLTFFLVREIFGTKKDKGDILGLIAAGILAVSPWHIMLSRAAFEANVSTFFIGMGVLFFVVAVKRNMWFLSISILSFMVSIYTFNSPRIVAPLLVLMLSIGFYKVLWKNKKQTILAVIIGIILLLPILPFLLSPQASLRFKEVNIFTNLETINLINQEIENDRNSIISKLIHNRRIVFGVEFLKHYLDNLDPNFLFIKGDGNPRFSTQDVGQLYIVELPFLLIGVIFLFKKRTGYWWIIPLWFLIGILPAASARETPHALRIESSLPTFQILVAYGIFGVGLWLWGKQKKAFTVFVVGYSLLLLFNVYYFLHGYFNHYPREYASEWQYGYKDAVFYTKEHESEYDQIYMTSMLGRPYIYFLFYNAVSPQTFRQTSDITRDAFGFVTVNGFSKYRFLQTIPKKVKQENALYIDIPMNIPPGAKVQKTFYLPGGDVALVAYTI